MIKKHSTLIVLVALTLFILEGLFQTIIGAYLTGWQFYFGAALVLLYWILYFLKINRLRTLLGIGLTLGFLNIIEFTYYHLTFAFSWTPLGQAYTSIGFQPIVFIILAFFLVTNSSRVGELIRSISARNERELEESENNLIVKYRTSLQNENMEKLKSIVAHPNEYQKEYVCAARELIKMKRPVSH